ncbi:DRC10 protein, partial [Jacana jacana]|nr:DRC10 protein [Jacana jacana]
GMQTPEKATTASNATKMLDLGGLKPNSTEVERILTVLEETLAQLELSSLIPRVIEALDRFADVLGPEITNHLKELQRLSNEMQDLLPSSEEKDRVGADGQAACLCSLQQRLSSSARGVLRLLRASPSLCQALKHEAVARGSPAEAFIKAFREFRNFVLERLLTSPTEEERKVQFLEDISLQIQRHAKAVGALQAELAAATRTREQEIYKKDNVIRDLKSSMQDLTTDCKASIQNIKEEGAKKQEEELEASQERCARLQQDVQQLEAQLNALVLEHRASELALLKRKRRMETEIFNWIQKYDAHMEEKQAEYEEVHAAYTEEKNQLSLLMERRALLLQEYSQIEEERRKQEEKEERELEELNTLSRAATRIQAFWKGYLVRSLYSSKLKKKKKGKGKGKGKGKKTKK